jgi:pyruvate dehydrogenase E2 component (dihydrolipoamide acetyltransferase)
VNIGSLQGSGDDGRVTMEDVKSASSGGGATGTYGATQPAAVPQIRTLPTPGGPLEERIAVRGLRKKISEKMTASEAHVVPFTFVEECDVTSLAEARERIVQSGIEVTFLPFIMKAIVASMKKFPAVNAVLDEAKNELVVKRYYHFGIGVATDAGLSVVVVHDVDKRSIREIAAELKRLSNDARASKSAIADVSGSTFTITSLGAQGGILATPVVNYPEVAILGVHRMKEMPVVRGGQIVIRKMMNLSGTFDHRMIDGHVGAAFMYEVIKYLEDPNLLFVEMV